MCNLRTHTYTQTHAIRLIANKRGNAIAHMYDDICGKRRYGFTLTCLFSNGMNPLSECVCNVYCALVWNAIEIKAKSRQIERNTKPKKVSEFRCCCCCRCSELVQCTRTQTSRKFWFDCAYVNRDINSRYIQARSICQCCVYLVHRTAVWNHQTAPSWNWAQLKWVRGGEMVMVVEATRPTIYVYYYLLLLLPAHLITIYLLRLRRRICSHTHSHERMNYMAWFTWCFLFRFWFVFFISFSCLCYYSWCIVYILLSAELYFRAVDMWILPFCEKYPQNVYTHSRTHSVCRTYAQAHVEIIIFPCKNCWLRVHVPPLLSAQKHQGTQRLFCTI